MPSPSPEAQSEQRRKRLYLLFALFGGGAGWISTTLAFMQVPIYQRHFTGLSLSNRLALGYNLGTLPAALWVLALWTGWRPSKRSSSIYALLTVQLAAVACLLVAVPGSPLFSVGFLAFAQFLGGACGYCSQFVCVPYLVSTFENELVGAFLTGDAAASVLAALIALVQEPASRPPRFGLAAYVALAGLPIILASVAACVHIERTGAGRLPEDASRRLIESEADAPSGVKPFWLEPLTWKLGLVVFWSQFADWGIGDSVYPYACANADTGGVERCEMWSNELSLAAQLVGCAVASRIALNADRLTATLWVPVAIYTGWFALLLVTSWAGSSKTPRLDERGVLVDLFVLRGLGPYARAVVPRLIQPCYDRRHHESLPVFFGVLAVVGNVSGSLVATGLIGAKQFGTR